VDLVHACEERRADRVDGSVAPSLYGITHTHTRGG
jgi:hypothetical protein